MLVISDFCFGRLHVFRRAQPEMLVEQSVFGEIEIRPEKEIADFQLGFVQMNVKSDAVRKSAMIFSILLRTRMPLRVMYFRPCSHSSRPNPGAPSGLVYLRPFYLQRRRKRQRICHSPSLGRR